jgi:predicted transposase/invertase (TIGR01784 family)
MNISSPHDAFFKEVFSHQDHMRDLIEGTFPANLLAQLDLARLELDNTAYIDEELKEYFSDLVYSCPARSGPSLRIALLFEHKSYPVKYPHLQLLKYLLKIWEHERKQDQHLSVVVPVLFYHGQETWKYRTMPNYFGEIDASLVEFIPAFHYILVDLSCYDDGALKERLFQEVGVRLACLIMKHIFAPDLLERYLGEYWEMARLYFTEERGLRFLESAIRYLFSAAEISPERLLEQMAQISEQGGNLIMTAGEQLIEKGKQIGWRQGQELGRTEGILEGLADLLEIKFGPAGTALLPYIRQMTTIAELEEIRMTIKTATTIAEVRAWLQGKMLGS